MGTPNSKAVADKVIGNFAPASDDNLLRKKIESNIPDKSALDELVKVLGSEDAIASKFLNSEQIKVFLKDKPCKVKLVVVDLEKWHDHRVLAYVVGNISDMLGFTTYGLVHVGVQIGAYIVHWFNDSLVHFTDIASGSALLAADIGELNLNDLGDAAKLREVATICKDYNTTKKYDNKSCNCHTFVDDVLDTLQMKKDQVFEGQIGDYLKRLRTNVLAKEFIDPITKEKKIFNKHCELDDYVNQLLKQLNMTKEQFETENPGDYSLLKAFDRAFWLGKYHEDKKPLEGRTKEVIEQNAPKECPFKDPFVVSFVPKASRKASTLSAK